MTYRLGDLLSKDADFTYGYGSKGTDENFTFRVISTMIDQHIYHLLAIE